MNLGTAQVIRADSRHLPLADNSVDLVVTSPPYFALRSYTDGGVHYERQIGAEATPDEFVSSLLEVTAECVRVLKPSGSLWVNLGDKYNAYNGNRGEGTIQRNDVRQSAAAGNGLDVKSVRPKSLIGIPWRYALRCIDDLGLILRAEVIWSKPNGLPESVTDRVRRSHEQWFHFTLSPRYFSAVDEIREAHQHPHIAHTGPRVARGEVDGNAQHLRMGLSPLGKLPGSVWTDVDEPGDSLIRSVLSAVAAGALNPDEGERLLWTGTTNSGQRSAKATRWTAGDGSASTTVTGTDATGEPARVTGERTDSSTRAQSDPSQAASPSTTSAATDGASTLHTSSPSPSGRTVDVAPARSAAQPGTPTTSRTLTSDATASESAVDACPTEHESNGVAPPSVWQIATEPLRVPDHLGVDHFAAFPTEWPKRIISGWSPAGVCVACGEGRRPVTDTEPMRWKPSARLEAMRAQNPDGLRPTSGTMLSAAQHRITGYACACTPTTNPLCDHDYAPCPFCEELPPTRPAIVLDPFGGTGTTAMVAKALGRHGISVDMSADYCRLAEWRTNDRDQLAKVLGVAKADPVSADEQSLFDLMEGTA